MKLRVLGAGVTALVVVLAAPRAFAGEFDGQGEYHGDPGATFYSGFTADPERYVPEDADPACMAPMFSHVTAPDGLDGEDYLRIKIGGDCTERLVVPMPPTQGSYRVTMWTRHGGLSARFVTTYADGSGNETSIARFAPTGRTTSDGWMELATNELSIDGPTATRSYIRVANFAGPEEGVDLDALEVVPAGEFVAQATCSGLGDPACSDEEVCIAERCRAGRSFVPPLPHPAFRNDFVDMLEGRLRVYFGGKKTRAEDLPKALGAMEGMRTAETAWQFWSAWGRGIRELHDWHTGASSSIQEIGSARRLNVCFIEGEGDASQAAWPKDPHFADILVSHAGLDATSGLAAGDRLVAIDGVHPIEWARSLLDVDWGFHVASDSDIFAELAEKLGGPGWGGALIVRFARNFTVLRCDAAAGTCADVPETIEVSSLPVGGPGPDVACDNRPFYHLAPGSNASCPSCPGGDPATHYVFGDFFRGPVAETTPDEKIFGMVWDTLYGGGDPNGWVNQNISNAIADWKANARGVILDHRAGNGGTLDAAENLTKLVRPPGPIAVIRMPMEIGGDDGPADLAEGQAIFEKWKASLSYFVGDAGFDPELPVAMIIHRDGSASDYLPFGMKGAPKVRLFGPHATAGAFSTFVNYSYYGGITFQIASGDTIAFDGTALIGHGVEPDVVLLPRQSDLLAGKDTLHEAALAWVRQELKP